MVSTSNELRSLDLATDTANREIFLLREYRVRLIADLVTGKLDVREAAANLPVETEGLEDNTEIEEAAEETEAEEEVHNE